MSQYFKSGILEDGVHILTFDTPDSSANVFNRQALSELGRHLEAIPRDAKGLIFASAKPSIFIAGADLRELSRITSLPVCDRTQTGDDELREVITAGQHVFDRIADLPIPTAAAIHGACLGGGYELCLACDYRIASDDRLTKIGLPETTLGLLPAWGGSTRLPRLIGLPKALEIILRGKQLPAVLALKYGMIDAVVPREHVLRAAVQHIAKGPPSRTRHWLVNNPLAARVIASQARAQAQRTTRGHYPAVPKALEVVVTGLSGPLPESLALERNAFIELAKTPACRNLIDLFFLQERAKRLRVLTREAGEHLPRVGNIAVIGAGIMGGGIAQWASAHGHKVILRDIDEERVRNGMAAIADIYRQGLARHQFDKVSARQGMDHISPSAREVPLKRVDLVIEAAVEKIEMKRQIFQRVAELARDDAVLATNTSALSVSEIAAVVKNPERVIGLHFFNPVHRMRLVEIVMGAQTTTAVTERVLRFVQGIGKLPVVVKDSPGFLVNRLLMPYLVEAVALFEAGASVLEIDEAMLDFGMPMGPLRVIDEVGIDIAVHVASHMSDHFSDRMVVPHALTALVDGRHLGRKTASGFYVYRKRGSPKPNRGIRHLVTSAQAKRMARKDLQERMVLAMVNEAARCLEEGIVSEPKDVDLAMTMGAGFAPFTGGPLRYADSVGILHLVTRLTHLTEDANPRFAPCALLRNMAKDQKRFYA